MLQVLRPFPHKVTPTTIELAVVLRVVAERDPVTPHHREQDIEFYLNRRLYHPLTEPFALRFAPNSI